MTIVFVYKKENDIKFINSDSEILSHSALTVYGYKHIASINPALILNKIFDVIDEEYSSDEKINEIKNIISTP